MDLIDQPYFRFIWVFMEGLGINKIVGLAIDKAISTETNIAIGFFGVFLW